MRDLLARAAGMNRHELAWRAKAAARIVVDRAMFHARRPRWDRRALGAVLADDRSLGSVHRAAARFSWLDAHGELVGHFASRPARFPIVPARKRELVAAILAAFPASAADAGARGDRIIEGRHDLLGYTQLTFDGWHHDPVHARVVPLSFWADVRYLDPNNGDHKIIWERNRHQHALALGRAYWLTGRSAYRQRFLLDLASWLDANPPLAGINWASMLELSLRSLSWVWALHFFVDASEHDEAPWLVDLLVALDRQLTQVERNLSYYFSPNTHLLGEALSLYVVGRVVPELRHGRRWETLGRRVLLAETRRQIAADGGHCERSTHYHRYALDFYLLALAVARLTGDDVAQELEPAVARLARAARLLADDRGRAPHIGDDDGGMLAPFGGRAVDDWCDSLAIAGAMTGRTDLATGAPPEEAFWWLGADVARSFSDRLAQPSGTVLRAVPSRALPQTGYCVSRSPRGDHLVIDAGPHGYQNGGHAHADALSLAYTVAGVPFLIDCGTGCYTADPALRNRMRSTALHNALVVDGRSQSIPQGPFHWRHTAEGSLRRWRANDGFDYFEGEHDGYRPVAHRRHVLALHGDLLVVADLVHGAGEHSAAAHWQIEPRWQVHTDGRRATFRHGVERVELLIPTGILESFRGDAATGLGWHAPVYGRVVPATTLRVTNEGQSPFWTVSVFGLNRHNVLRSADVVPVWAEAGALRSSIGLRVARESSIDHLLIAERADDSRRTTWRLAEFETDAHLLFVRAATSRADGQDSRVTRLAIVDGSQVHAASRRALELSVPRTVSDLHVDAQSGARLAGGVAGTQVIVNGVELSIDAERRTAPRARHTRSKS